MNLSCIYNKRHYTKVVKEKVSDYYNDINFLDGRSELNYGELIDCNRYESAKEFKDMYNVHNIRNREGNVEFLNAEKWLQDKYNSIG